jgi:hypothetical protein
VQVSLGRIDVVAAYAAILSTIVFLWQVYTWWRKGPRLRLALATNMVTYGSAGKSNDSYVTYNVANIGDADTTITHVAIYGYPNWWTRVRRRPTLTAIVDHAVVAYPIPYVLKPGQTFMSMAIQSTQLEQWSREFYLYGVIIHSVSRRPLTARIRPIKRATPPK